jgi:hypothetical protein
MGKIHNPLKYKERDDGDDGDDKSLSLPADEWEL